MNDGYIIYRCKICGKHFILMTNEVEHSEKESKFITCPFHGKHKNIRVIGRISKYGEIKGCMDQRSYYKEGRKIKQR